LERSFAAPVHHWWGTSEANLIGASCGESAGMHLHDDLFVVEPVDSAGRAVAPGTRSSGLLLTNLRNLALPLLRYETSNEVTPLDGPCPCGSPFRRVDDVQGRVEESFAYADGTVVHPHVFRSRLGAEPTVLEYRVHQTPDGAHVQVRCAGPVDLTELGAALSSDLRGCGLGSAQVIVSSVDVLDRGVTGKLRRFVPMITASGPSAVAEHVGPTSSATG
jgi:phenylacetate-coenzyme A ligase PaaK-like adenylate-forming protein